jgi:serine/threonine-protein kinase HipA
MSKAVPSLSVRWYDDRLVGHVVTNGPTVFAYTEEWLATGHNLSPLWVPFSTAIYRQRASDFDQLPGFLSDSLPDQWGRRLMDRAFSALNLTATPMRRLAWVGNRAIGALRFAPVFEASSSASSWEPVTTLLLAREAQAVLHEAPTSAFEHLKKGGTAGGALPKATVALLPDESLLIGGDVAAAVSSQPEARLGLLKIDCDENPSGRVSDGRLEHAFMSMARAAGIRTAATHVLNDVSGKRALHHLFVERFDYLPGTPRRNHLLTLAGALHAHSLTYRDLLRTTRELSADQTEVLEATRRMIFNVRAANADDHGKNHSFLYDDARRLWRLSPAYDVTLNADEGKDYQGLTPNTFGSSPQLSALAGVAADYGVDRGQFDEIDAEVASAIERWPTFADEAQLPPDTIARVSGIHQGRIATLSSVSAGRRTKRVKRW